MSSPSLSIHPPAIVHVSPVVQQQQQQQQLQSLNIHPQSNRDENENDIDDDCSDLSSAPNSLGRGTTGSEDDDDDDDDNYNDYDDNNNHTNHNNSDLNQRIAAAMIEHTRQLQRHNSAFLGRQSRKSRLRRRTMSTDGICVPVSPSSSPPPSPPSLQHHNYSIEEKKCDTSHTSHNSNTTNHNDRLPHDEQQEGDELPLLPRRRQRHSIVTTNTPTASLRESSFNMTHHHMNTGSNSTVTGSHHTTLDDHSVTPMDEMDELDYQHHAPKQQQQPFTEHPPPFDEVDEGVVTTTIPISLDNDDDDDDDDDEQHGHRPSLLWKESESYDDDIELYMAPTDETLDVHHHHHYQQQQQHQQQQPYGHADHTTTHIATTHTAFNDTDGATSLQRHWYDIDHHTNIPLDETFIDLTCVQEHDHNEDDLPPIAPVPKYGTPLSSMSVASLDRPFTPLASSMSGQNVASAIVVEEMMTDTNLDLAETNVLNISMDSNDSSAGPIGPLIRLEQHQPLLHSNLDEISSSDETPLTGNGPLAARVHRNRTYREPKLHGYWKEQQQQQNQRQHRQKVPRRKRALRIRKVISNNDEGLPSATYQPNENSMDHILPPLIIDPDQLRSIGITAILAVCNGIGSLFLTHPESSSSSPNESPRDKTAERYKLLSNDVSDQNSTKRRAKGGSKGRKIKLEPEEMSPSDQTGNTSTSDVTPVYFEDALQRSIEAEIKAGDKRLAVPNIPIHTRHDVLDHPFADFATSDLETIDSPIVHPYNLKRTISAPVTTSAPQQQQQSRESTDRLWLDKIRAVKCSSQQPTDERYEINQPNNPLHSISESSSSVLNERKSSREKKHWLRSVTLTERFATTPDDEIIPLESNTKEKVNVGKRRILPAAARRIAALRDSKNKAMNHSKNDGRVETNPSLYSPAISSFVAREGALSPISPIMERQTRSDESSPIIHTPLAEPPALRRLNKSLEFDESFGSDFSVHVPELEEPPSLSRPTNTVLEMSEVEFSREPEGDIPPITIKSSTVPKNEIKTVASLNIESKPSADRSPMSDFLLLRLQASSSDMSSMKPKERSGSPYDDSDCSSTGELLCSLDGLVKDLDGMATSRRVERKLTSDSKTLLFPESYVPDGTCIVEDHMERSVLDIAPIGMPELLDSLNNDFGIPRGDIMISLLKSDKVEPSWMSRVDEAIWRGRTMRHQFNQSSLHTRHHELISSLPLKRRTSFCVDVDDGRVVVGIDKVTETQIAANEMLKDNEFDDGVALYEAISWSYEQYMDDMEPLDDRMDQMKSYVAMAQYNLGIIHMLRGEHDDAIEYFEQSTLLYSTSLDVGHAMHVSSLVKTAICHFAMEDYTTAYTELELALSLSRDGIHTLSDHRQIAEVLNNLGSLSYMGGEIERSMLFFRESINILSRAVDFATYSESKFDSHSTMLALSIAKSNVAFLSLTFYRDVSESVKMFESVIQQQQLLLRDADVSLLATLEHLAAANLLAGDKSKALQLLRRVLRIQIDAYGSSDNGVCERTRHKIAVLEQSDNEGIGRHPNEGFETTNHRDGSSCSVTTTTGNTILPILETSRESSGSNSHNSSIGSSSNNNNNNSSRTDDVDSSPNTSMTNTLKAWRESHAITGECFLTNHVIM